MSKHLLNLPAALITAATLLAAPAAQAQIRTPAASPQSTVTQRVGLTDVTIVYSRPSVKGRAIFGERAGAVWQALAHGRQCHHQHQIFRRCDD